jgi:hypothetical protein
MKDLSETIARMRDAITNSESYCHEMAKEIGALSLNGIRDRGLEKHLDEKIDEMNALTNKYLQYTQPIPKYASRVSI